MTPGHESSSRLVDLALPGEDGTGLPALLARLTEVYAPEDGLEQLLVERLAAALWKEGRGDRLEAQALGAEGGTDRALLALALRYQAAAQTAARRALDLLVKHRKAKRQRPVAAAPVAPGPDALPAIEYEPANDDAAVSPLQARLARLLDRRAPKQPDDLDLADAVCALLVPDWPAYAGPLGRAELEAALAGMTLTPRDLDWLAGHELARACRGRSGR